jgi:hypothetical protein
MISRSLIRRLERLETRLGAHRKRYFRIEYYDRSPDGTLIRQPHSDDDRTEAERTFKVVFVSPAPPPENGGLRIPASDGAGSELVRHTVGAAPGSAPSPKVESPNQIDRRDARVAGRRRRSARHES